jgi:hypothetical protein
LGVNVSRVFAFVCKRHPHHENFWMMIFNARAR